MPNSSGQMKCLQLKQNTNYTNHQVILFAVNLSHTGIIKIYCITQAMANKTAWLAKKAVWYHWGWLRHPAISILAIRDKVFSILANSTNGIKVDIAIRSIALKNPISFISWSYLQLNTFRISTKSLDFKDARLLNRINIGQANNSGAFFRITASPYKIVVSSATCWLYWQLFPCG